MSEPSGAGEIANNWSCIGFLEQSRWPAQPTRMPTTIVGLGGLASSRTEIFNKGWKVLCLSFATQLFVSACFLWGERRKACGGQFESLEKQGTKMKGQKHCKKWQSICVEDSWRRASLFPKQTARNVVGQRINWMSWFSCQPVIFVIASQP